MNATSYRSGTLWISDRTIAAPLDWGEQDGESIELFVREVVALDKRDQDLPLLVFLQGGPGGEGPRPLGTGWWSTAALTHRVVLLDQRGTGRSTPVTAARLATLGGPREQADYLACFRGESIVRDAELVRTRLYESERWATLGQSYGGFLTLIYLSLFPGSLTACHITGGLPSIAADAASVYRATYPRQAYLNEQFYRRYPEDEATVAAIADQLAAAPAQLPNGDLLDVRRLQLLGMPFGMSTGLDRLHWLLDTAFDGDQLSARFLAEVAHETSFAANPLYAVLQECIYQQGSGASNWAAETERARHPHFDPAARPLFFTGEMIYPWMFDDFAELRPFAAATRLLHERADWPQLYDADRLAANDVPVAAVQYYDDPYVELGLAMTNRTALGNLEVWVTSEFLHDGLRMSAETILPRLFAMTAGR